jgi:hypothetical protein
MKANREATEVCLEKTEARLENKEPTSVKKEPAAVHEEVAAVKPVTALKKRHMDRHVTVSRRIWPPPTDG